MTPRQFGVLQHLDTVGWDLPINISSRVFGATRSHACKRSLTMLAKAGLIEQVTKRFTTTTSRPLVMTGWQITEAGNEQLVAENLRLLKEIT